MSRKVSVLKLYKVTEKSTGNHFNSPGHSLSDMKISVIEQCKRKGAEYRKEREHDFIRKFNTFYKGLNRLKPYGGGGEF